MIIRQIEAKDLDVIEEMNKIQGDFKLTNIDNCIIDRIVYDGHIPVAYGIVKRLAEAIMLINPNAPKLIRAKAMRELMKYAESGCYREKIYQLHCFVSNPKLGASLAKQFKFIKSNDICMVKNLD
jgi:hypothetical protein